MPFLTIPKRRREVIPADALAALFSAPPQTRIGIRDRAILILLFDSAIRADEMLGLKVSDLSLDAREPYIRIHGKGNKDRVVSVRKRTVKHLKLYLETYHASEKCSFVFLL